MSLAESDPLLSVVMAVYNGETYLETAICSVLGQSFTDFEFLIIDDGSEDGTAEIIHAYEQRDARIKVIQQDHAGLIPSLNRGCSIAKGRYIARLDSDDIAMKDRFRLQVAHMTRHPETVLLGSRTECIDHAGQVLFTMNWPGWSEGLRDYLLLDCYVAHTAAMFHKDTFSQLGGYRPQFQDAEDYDLFLRMSDQHVVDNLPVVLCQYRLHQQQVSARKLSQQAVSGIGIRLATTARRAGRPEPQWAGPTISRSDLIRYGINPARIDSLVATFEASNERYAEGWRWSRTKFCELPSKIV
jgi:glycosyltransferase involved in cell wall biosynthesis